MSSYSMEDNSSMKLVGSELIKHETLLSLSHCELQSVHLHNHMLYFYNGINAFDAEYW